MSVLGNLPEAVRVVEVGPRDGLQNEATTISTADKVAFVDLLSATGARDIEVTAFVSPRAVPQMADAEAVLAAIAKRPAVRYSALVPNVRGLERWLGVATELPADARAIAFFTAASETFSLRNTNVTIAQSLENLAAIMVELEPGLATSDGPVRPFVRAYVSTAFVCPYEGAIDPERTEWLVRELLSLGVDEVSVGDTVGAATPGQVARLCMQLVPVAGAERLALHLHDTRGTALANVLAALQCGVAIFDAAAGGLGGCPFAPGAAGNLATEDLIYLLDGLGIETGISFDALVRASRYLAGIIDHPLPGKAFQASQAVAEEP